MKNTVCALAIIFGIEAVFATPAVYAADSGTIDSTYKYAWGENIGWVNFGSSEGNVLVSDTALTGYAWSENAGWLSLNCSNTSSCATVDYKVANNTGGSLSGYAWGENIGWVSFRPAFGGVSIDSDGNFKGYGWGENIGWVSFNCTNTSSCGTVTYRVNTTWRPSGGSGGGAGAPPPSTTGPSPTVEPTPTASPSEIPEPSQTPGAPLPGTQAPGAEPAVPKYPITNPPATPPDYSVNPIGPPSVNYYPEPSTPLESLKRIPREIARSLTGPISKIAKYVISIAPDTAKSASVVSVPLVAASSAVNIFTLLTSGIRIFDYFQYFAQALLLMFGIKRRVVPWGTIYNSATQQPLPFTKIQLKNSSSRIVETRITDHIGRYGFLVNPDTSPENPFTIEVIKEGFIFPSRASAALRQNAILYRNQYYGDPINIKSGELLHFDIPVDPQTIATQSHIRIPRMFLHNTFVLAADIAFWVSIVVAPLNYFFQRSTFNLVILIMLLSVNALRFIGGLREKPYGLVLDINSKTPFPYALITLQNAMGQRKGIAVSDQSGKYILLTEKGKFDVSIFTPADVHPPRRTNETVSTKRGWIAKKFHL